MTEKETLDINDSNTSESSSIEELDLRDDFETVTEEIENGNPLDISQEQADDQESSEDTAEPLEILQEEVVAEEAKVETSEPSETIQKAGGSDETKIETIPSQEASQEITPNGESAVESIDPFDELQAEIVSEKAADESDQPVNVFEMNGDDGKIAEEDAGKLDSDIINEAEPLAIMENTVPQSTAQKAESATELTLDSTGGSDTNELGEDGFLGLDDEEFVDSPSEEQALFQDTVTKPSAQDTFEKISDTEDESAENFTKEKGNQGESVKSTQKTKRKWVIEKPSRVQFIIGLTLLVFAITGGVFYLKPSLFNFEKEAIPAPMETKKIESTEPKQPEQPIGERIGTIKPSSKFETYLAKIQEADDLRDKLLQKNEEIYLLKLHYQNGIVELEDQIKQALRKQGITTYKAALKNRPIELKLRTIQRRRSYLLGLEKPIRWIDQGSEELLYLKRKAEVDLELIDLADGIDMERHMRHLDAAIQKFRPSAEKLAVHHDDQNLLSLKVIWQQIKRPKQDVKESAPNVRDEKIGKDICNGNYQNLTELTNLSVKTAKCLSNFNGPDLFLNSLKALSGNAARSLFEWRGNWICMNGIKKLSPSTAKYLFKWDGNWISLNGLTEFPPELAAYLMEWEGKQLELMGLQYNSKNADHKALKYLALWETMGGKLYISDTVRKEIERVLR